MKMIKIILTVTYLLLSSAACAEGSPISIKLKVVDQDSKPVENASVFMGFLLSRSANVVEGKTDAEGMMQSSGNGTFGVKITVNKDGYYLSKRRTGYGDQNLVMELRELKQPIPMYVSKLKNLKQLVSSTDGKIGYDLQIGDFLPPNGKGSVADIIFSGNYSYEKAFHHRSDLLVEFSNQFDGLISFKVDERDNRWQRTPESQLVSRYSAPESGYLNRWSFNSNRSGAESPILTNYVDSNNYYFRVRTEIDAKGNVASAYYGKIYGEFPNITHYFNPTENDRNIEFDTKKNLSETKLHLIDP